ncbi:MAG TPA: hypothetical protein VIJ15_14750 [Dermatophilaceae bacterium]
MQKNGIRIAVQGSAHSLASHPDDAGLNAAMSILTNREIIRPIARVRAMAASANS